MNPQDVPDQLMTQGREALVHHLRTLPKNRIPTFEERVRIVLAAVLPEAESRTLNAAADKLESLPETDGAALKGPYWYREGFKQAGGLLRDWADYPPALDGFRQD